MSKNIKGLVLITGTTSVVGLNTLKPLLRFGWEVIAGNRSNKRAIKIAEESLTKEEVKNVHFIEIDLSNLDDVRRGCDEILERFETPINSLICNAAVYKPRLKRPERSPQGFENSMAVNHFGHFLMINLLIENILSSEREIFLIIKISFSLLAIISLIKLGYSSKVRLTRLREIEESFLYEKYRFNLLTDKFDDLFSSEGEQRFMKDQDQIISRDIIRVIWR